MVPDEATLAAAARGFARDLLGQRHLAELAEQIGRKVESMAFGELQAKVAQDLRYNPEVPWDASLRDLVRGLIEDAEP